MNESKLFDDLFISFIDETIDRKKLYDTITEISKSKKYPYDSAVKCDNKIFCMDGFSSKVNKILENSTNKHSSVDGFYYLKNNEKIVLFFIEFKIIDNTTCNYRDYLKNTLKPKLLLKSLESLNCVLPHLISQNFSEENANNLKDMIYRSEKYYLCVILNPDVSATNAHDVVTTDYMNLERLSPYPFEKVYPMSPKKFKEFFQEILIKS